MYDPEFITSTSDVIIFEGDNSIVIRRFIDVNILQYFVAMRVFVEYKKKIYEFDVKESMKIGEFKELVSKECIYQT